jgi:Sec-independent protein translocase protein TatA
MMFSVGFWELLIIFAVIILLIKPEQLPECFKKAGIFVRMLRDIKDEITNYVDKVMNNNKEDE